MCLTPVLIKTSPLLILKCKGYGVKCHFQQCFSYIMAVSFIGGGNRRTRRKSLICRNTDKLFT